MKECPVCHAQCFDDMEVCYGCMYRFAKDSVSNPPSFSQEDSSEEILEIEEPDNSMIVQRYDSVPHVLDERCEEKRQENIRTMESIRKEKQCIRAGKKQLEQQSNCLCGGCAHKRQDFCLCSDQDDALYDRDRATRISLEKKSLCTTAAQHIQKNCTKTCSHCKHCDEHSLPLQLVITVYLKHDEFQRAEPSWCEVHRVYERDNCAA